MTRQAALAPRRTLAALLVPGDRPPPAVDDHAWASVLDVAADADLLPALRVALDRHHLLPSPPEAVRAAAADRLPAGHRLPADVLDLALEANRRRIDDLLDQACTVLAALDDAGIPATPLKGTDALLVGRYPVRAARTMTDVDVLVPAEAAAEAERLLAELGYQQADAPPADHQLPPRRRPDRAGSIELHTALVSARWSALVDPAAVLRRARCVADGTPGLRLAREDAVTHLLAHAQLHDDADLLWRTPLRALHETALLLVGDEAVDWDVVAQAFARVERVRALEAHLVLVEQLFGAPTPRRPGLAGRLTAQVELGLLDRPVLQDRIAEVRYLPRALSAERMAALHGARGRRSTWAARAHHVAQGLRRWRPRGRPPSGPVSA